MRIYTHSLGNNMQLKLDVTEVTTKSKWDIIVSVW